MQLFIRRIEKEFPIHELLFQGRELFENHQNYF